MKRFFIVLVAIISIVTMNMNAGVANALGVAVGPNEIKIENALRGNEYERTIAVFNPSDEETNYSITINGTISQWVSFHDMDTGNIVQTVAVPGKDHKTLSVKIAIPEDIANDTYTGVILVKNIPVQSSGESSVATVLQAKSELIITISGDQIVDINVISIRIRDTEVGLAGRVETLIKNTGNVAVEPEIDCVISRLGETITQFNDKDFFLGVEKQETFISEWQTDNTWLTGEYTATVTVSLNGEEVTTQDIVFELLPAGTLTKNGEFTYFSIDGQPKPGSLSKIVSEFTNTGEVASYAKLVGEIYYEGSLTDTFESDQALVQIGQSVLLSVYYTFEKEGDYRISAYINYDGKHTSTEEIEVTVQENTDTGTGEVDNSGTGTNDEDDGTSSNMFLFVGLPIIIVVALSAGIIYYIRARGKKSTTEPDTDTDTDRQ